LTCGFRRIDKARLVYENSSFLSFVLSRPRCRSKWITEEARSDFGLITRQEKEHFAIAQEVPEAS
jgi:hypothetical protein